jgi:hypothetical protein
LAKLGCFPGLGDRGLKRPVKTREGQFF